MKRLAVLLCVILLVGIMGAGALAKKTSVEKGNGNGKGNGYGRGGKYEGAPEWAGTGKPSDEEEPTGGATEATEETEEETEEDPPTPKSPADYNGLNRGNGKTRHLYLYQKNPDDWTAVFGGAWGKMTFRPSGKKFRFNFKGHGLEPGEEYCLIYYPDPWPGAGLICLGSGVANQGGNVHISDRVDIASLPIETDDNFDPEDPDSSGAKIWLVLSSDVECDGDPPQMVGWNPDEYLFEYDLVAYEDTDAPLE